MAHASPGIQTTAGMTEGTARSFGMRQAVVIAGSLIGGRGLGPALLDLLLLCALAVPALMPLMQSGYLQGSDAMDQPWRSLVLREALAEGVLFPRWGPDLFYGYGFPLFNYYAPLSFYGAVLFDALLSIDLVEATKVAYGASLLFSGFGAYLLARGVVVHRGASLLAGTLYLYAPFTLSEVFVRSNMAGAAGLALLPFVLAAFVRLCWRPSFAMSGIAALLLAALILTHNITAMVAFGMVGMLVALRCAATRDRKLLLAAALALALGLGAASFFWVPAVGEKELVHTEKLYDGAFHFGYHFVDPLGDVDENLYSRGWWEPYQMTRWGSIDLHPAYPYGSPPYKLSLFQGLLLLLCVAALARSRGRPFMAASLFLVGLSLFFLHTSWSRLIWDTIPVVTLVQYPWRLTGPLGLCLAVVGSWALLSLVRDRRALLLPLVGAMGIISSLWMLPTELAPFEGGTQVTRENLVLRDLRERNRFGTKVDSQLLPLSIQWENMAQGDIISRYDQDYPPERWVEGTALVAPESRAWILATRRGQLWMQAEVEAGEAALLAFHTIYFPGWTAYLDGERAPMEVSSWREYEEGRRAALGVCQLWVPEGRHTVTLVFEDTELRRWSRLLGAVNLLGIGLLMVVALWRRGSAGRDSRHLTALLLALATGVGLGYALHQWTLAPGAPDWAPNRVVLELVAKAEQRRLSIAVPEGGKADDYVHPRTFTIDGDSRAVVYMHPPASASARVWLPEGAKLEFAVGLDPQVWEKAGDGVEFRVEVREGSNSDPLFSLYLDPKSDPSHRRWIDTSVELGRYAHREVELVLRTLPGASGEFDWAGWAEPRVVLP